MNDAETIWNEYSKAIDMWMKSYKVWKNSGKEAMKFYLDGCKLAMKSSNLDEVEKYHQLWQKTIENLKLDPFSLSNNSWDEMWKNSGFENLDAFQNYWQGMWKNFVADTPEKSESPLSEDEIMEQFNDSKSGESSRMSSREKSK